MTPNQFIENLNKENNTDYGLCPPPISAEKGLDVLINHLLGDNWYTTMPLGKEQVYTEAIYAILQKYPNKSGLKGLFT